MSASLVHFAVCDDVCRIVRAWAPQKIGKDIEKACKDYPNYARLGSIGPDIPYFESPVEGGIKMFLDIHIPITPNAYVLHSKTPNLFAVNLFRLVLADSADLAGEKQADLKLLAFAVGYLTHVATDHIIHPFVNANAGKYYVRDENKARHRMIEIYHDVHLFREMYKKDEKNKKLDPVEEFVNKDFEAKIDIVDESFLDKLTGNFWDTELTFRVLLQRAFLETYGMNVAETTIENWVDGAMLTLSNINHRVSPYTRAIHKPKPEWMNLAFKKGNVSDPKFFYDPDDAIVEFTSDIWRRNAQAGPGAEQNSGKLGTNMQKTSNKSLYARAILQSVKYIQAADKYVEKKDTEAFIKAIPPWDLSDPQSKTD
ncbi:MAG: zinc dependent phospholipase C family protein [Sedimentisphaerales bacterium]|nr:zinc dependent phospholipase C family protein [Sedimentisphaerales bacterium]